MHRGAWYFHSKCKIVLIHGCVRAIVLTTIFLTGPFMSAACITALALRPFSCRVDTVLRKKQPAWYLVDQLLTIEQRPVFPFLPTSRAKFHSFIRHFSALPLDQEYFHPFKYDLGRPKLRCKHIASVQIGFLLSTCAIFRLWNSTRLYQDSVLQMHYFFTEHFFFNFQFLQGLPGDICAHQYSSGYLSTLNIWFCTSHLLQRHTGLAMSRLWLLHSFLPNLMPISDRHPNVQSTRQVRRSGLELGGYAPSQLLPTWL